MLYDFGPLKANTEKVLLVRVNTVPTKPFVQKIVEQRPQPSREPPLLPRADAQGVKRQRLVSVHFGA